MLQKARARRLIRSIQATGNLAGSSEVTASSPEQNREIKNVGENGSGTSEEINVGFPRLSKWIRS